MMDFLVGLAMMAAFLAPPIIFASVISARDDRKIAAFQKRYDDWASRAKNLSADLEVTAAWLKRDTERLNTMPLAEVEKAREADPLPLAGSAA